VRVKVFGERNSGTNFVEQLIRENQVAEVIKNIDDISDDIRALANDSGLGWLSQQFLKESDWDRINDQAPSNRLGWKHRFVSRDEIDSWDDQTRTVFVIRNPISWARSMHSRPYHALVNVPKDFSDFIVRPWLCVRRENSPRRVFETPLQLWAAKNRQFIEVAQSTNKAIVVRQEDTLIDIQEVSERLSRFLEAPVKPWSVPEENARKFESDNRTYQDYARAFDWAKVTDGLSTAEAAAFEHDTGDIIREVFPEIDLS